MAYQTARATEDIRDQISEIQKATERAVAAVRDMSGIMQEASASASNVVAAISEHGNATAEIARAISLTSASTEVVSAHLADVSRSAHEARLASAEMTLRLSTLRSGGINPCNRRLNVFMLRSVIIQSIPANRNPPSNAPSNAPDPALQAGLAELFQMGLAVARVSARLAEMEGRAIEALAEAAAETTRNTIAKSDSLADAIDAGHRAEASDAARDAIAVRIAAITASFDQAARAVRRTAALQARLAEGVSFRAHAPGRGGPAGHAANDAEQADRGDDPEWGDEIGERADEDVVRDIGRDLAPNVAPATQGETPFSPPLPAAIRAIYARSTTPGARPRILRSASEPPGVLPEPDT